MKSNNTCIIWVPIIRARDREQAIVNLLGEIMTENLLNLAKGIDTDFQKAQRLQKDKPKEDIPRHMKMPEIKEKQTQL